MRMDVVDSQKSDDILFVAKKLNGGRTKKQSARKPSSPHPQRAQCLGISPFKKNALCAMIITGGDGCVNGSYG